MTKDEYAAYLACNVCRLYNLSLLDHIAGVEHQLTSAQEKSVAYMDLILSRDAS